MIEQKPEVKPAFINNKTNKPKEIECIRVDGAGDQGPLHKEVQYWWTRSHFEKGNHTMLISTRNSGSSYRNRVELQNGCTCTCLHSVNSSWFLCDKWRSE
jgi:hypothetical protein